jgi:hypothetical protein
MPNTKIANKTNITNSTPNDLGDVHAPVEDTDVPLSLKFLVFLMLVTLVGLGALIWIVLTRFPSLLTG